MSNWKEKYSQQIIEWVSDVDMPEVTGSETTEYEDPTFTVKVSVEHDECWGREDEWDGKFFSFNRNHTTFIDYDEADERFKDNPKAVKLSYYEHGASMWSPAGSGPQCQWDTTQFAGWWVPHDDQVLPEGKTWYSVCAEECKYYTQWINGWMYSYSVEVYDHTGKLVSEDSCGGFYGLDEEYMHDQIREWLADEIDEFINDEIAELEAGQVGAW